MFDTKDILETISMIREEKLDIRTITMGISLYDCQSDDPKRLAQRIYDRIMNRARDLVRTGEEIEKKYGIPIINKRVSVTPVALMAGALTSMERWELRKCSTVRRMSLGSTSSGATVRWYRKGSQTAAVRLSVRFPRRFP